MQFLETFEEDTVKLLKLHSHMCPRTPTYQFLLKVKALKKCKFMENFILCKADQFIAKL